MCDCIEQTRGTAELGCELQMSSCSTCHSYQTKVNVDLEAQVASITTPKYSKIAPNDSVARLPASGATNALLTAGTWARYLPSNNHPAPAIVIGVHHLGRAILPDHRVALLVHWNRPLPRFWRSEPLLGQPAGHPGAPIPGGRVHDDGRGLGESESSPTAGPVGIYPLAPRR